ncbi:MAG TPA: hypothetical protein VFY59_16160 [Rubrobacter sp.]|nr:hypothetical protein [Rubrobacter sp.]
MAERDISSGSWLAHQSNRWNVIFNLDQTPDGKLSGSADATPIDAGSSMHGNLDTNASQVQANSVVITANWTQGSRGQYVGNFDLNGRLVGNTFDLEHPSSQAKWFSDKFL